MRCLMFAFLFFMGITTTTFAWNSVGHRLVAQIAYDELTPQAKAKIDALTDYMFHSKYPEARFLRASTWPDTIRKKAPEYTAWHFIDIPYVKDNRKPPALNAENVVWAIAHAQQMISDPKSTAAERATYLSFLIHFLGDIHQPMHTISLYSNAFPEGDRGGNWYPVQAIESDNLHGYWDLGLGYFYSTPGSIYAFRHEQIEAIAKQWIAKYPRSFFAKQLAEKSPMQWAMDGHQIAITFAYTLPQHTVPTIEYVHQGQMIVQKQIVLAGYRLADILNQLTDP